MSEGVQTKTTQKETISIRICIPTGKTGISKRKDKKLIASPNYVVNLNLKIMILV